MKLAVLGCTGLYLAVLDCPGGLDDQGDPGDPGDPFGIGGKVFHLSMYSR